VQHLSAVPASKKPLTQEELNVMLRARDAAVLEKMAERFSILEDMIVGAADGSIRSMIISGPPGLGKTWTINAILKRYDQDDTRTCSISGYSRPTGLIKALYEYRHTGCVLVFDDVDNIFFDEVGLSILKAIADTTKERRVSWLSEKPLFDDNGDRVPRHFDFNAAVIFVTNLDFEDLITKDSKMSKHLEALMSRSFYLDMAIKTRRHYLLRIRQVVEAGMLKAHLDETAVNEILDFIETNHEKLRDLSLRTPVKLGVLRKIHSGDWSRIARVTMCK
jgi:DNA polymerase III delta prime subunit